MKTYEFPGKIIRLYSETIRNNEINEESTKGSYKIYNVVIRHENERCRLWLRCMSSDTFIATVTSQHSAGKHHSTTTL